MKKIIKTVSPSSSLKKKLLILEASRIGFYAFDTDSNKKFSYRSEERFPFCSTFKTIAVSALQG